MTRATADHESTPFTQPPTVTTATICSLSGTLATDGCRSAMTVDAFGYVTSASTAYTEYFTRGTEPVEYCPFHQYELSPYLAAGQEEATDPTRPAGDAGTTPVSPLPAPVATTGVVPSSPRSEPAEARPRRRGGFVGWLFRRGARER